MITAETTAKIAMQITVVNQKTNSIRSISSDADVGQPGDEHGDHRRRNPGEDAVDHQADDRAPAHRGRAYLKAAPDPPR